MNRTPECRDAFIAAMKASGGDEEYSLEWTPLVSDGKGNADDPLAWEWDDSFTGAVYQDGWCLLYKPPSDVDPESLLGKLGIMAAGPTGDVLPQPMTPEDCVSIQAIIDTIESLQQRVRELEAEARGCQLLADGIPAIPGTSAWHPERAYRGTVQEGTSVAFRPTIGPNKYHSIGECYSSEAAMKAAKEQS